MMPDGMYITPELEEAVASGFDEAYAWAESEDLEHYCEKKPACLALHWRGLDPELVAEIKGKVEKEWNSLAGKRGLRFLEFDGGIELRPPGRDKGYAVDTVLEESGGDTIAAYLGDDYTDEDAFRALRGRGLSILVNRSLRNTAADIWLKPPSELLEFLNRWAGICGGENE
jgi:trehalose 6-phosphate phosphatase